MLKGLKCIGEMEEGSTPSSLKISGFIFVLARQEMVMRDVAMEMGSLLSMGIMNTLRGWSQLVALNLHRAQ